AMITKEEFEIASRIAKGQKARFTINRHNPDFPMNGMLCQKCFIESDITKGKLTGYRSHNGKSATPRKYYKRYHCRNCMSAVKQDDLHNMVSALLSKCTLDPALKQDLIDSLRKAWAEVEENSLQLITRLKTKLILAEEQKMRLVMSLADNPDLKADLYEAINLKKEEINIIKDELEKAQDIESDFNKFVVFSLDFVDNLKSEWWTLDHDDRLRCEQLLFPRLLRLSGNKKVSTPEISIIYRYQATKKTPVGALIDNSGGPAET
ncbi:hypothetical protein H7X69_00200, partial [Candidatus Saccharibacteria bacterium]|nr:hypothetical protein [Candidatus Saccharibacteria bacterium]